MSPHRSPCLIGSLSKPYQTLLNIFSPKLPLHLAHIIQGILQVQIKLIPLFTFTFVTHCCCYCFFLLAAAVAVAPMLAINIIACCRSVHQFVCLGVSVWSRCECVCVSACIMKLNTTSVKTNSKQFR